VSSSEEPQQPEKKPTILSIDLVEINKSKEEAEARSPALPTVSTAVDVKETPMKVVVVEESILMNVITPVAATPSSSSETGPVEPPKTETTKKAKTTKAEKQAVVTPAGTTTTSGKKGKAAAAVVSETKPVQSKGIMHFFNKVN
jgi:hypothetical protein